MRIEIKCIIFVHLVNFGSSTKQLKPANYGRDWLRPNGDPPRVTLVKRIIPHGYKTPPFEYDSRFNTIFVPKYRVQKRINLNTNKADLASKEFFLQPFKAFPEKKEEPMDILSVIKALQEKEKSQTQDNKAKFVSFDTYNGFSKHSKPFQAASVKYEKPWNVIKKKRSQTNSEESSLSQKKQQYYYKELDAFLKAITHLYDKESHKRKPRREKNVKINLDKQLYENNSENMEEPQAFEIIDDILKDLQNIENGETGYRSHQSENVEGSVKLKTPKVHKDKEININLNNLIQALQSIDNEELTEMDLKTLIQKLASYPVNKDNLTVSDSDTLDTLLTAIPESKKLHNKIKPNLKKLLFKSFKTYNMNKNELVANLQTRNILRLLQNTENEPSQSEFVIIGKVNADEPWDPIKLPVKNLEVTNDLNGLLNNLQHNTVYSESSETSSEGTQRQIKKPKINIDSVNLESLLDDGKVIGKRTKESVESRPLMAVPIKQSINLENLLKQLQNLNENEHMTTVNSIPLQPTMIFQKQNLNLIDPELDNREEKHRHRKEPIILYPTKDKKLKVAVRNLADLLKVWNYIQNKKYDIQPLRERGSNNVELDVIKTKKQLPFNFPHYSIWNFWTYDKTLLQDGCPGEQVKVGNKCIWTPPHRK